MRWKTSSEDAFDEKLQARTPLMRNFKRGRFWWETSSVDAWSGRTVCSDKSNFGHL